LPQHLDCTGLYKDADSEELAAPLELFTPVYPLWTDAAQKARWIYLPEGEKIDAQDSNAWKFPTGTRLWKAFRSPDGSRKLETRLFMKSEEGDWSYATYVWDDSGKRATRVENGKELDVDGKAYSVPTHTQCNECHAGRRERVMGFDAVTLGIPDSSHSSGNGAREGLTLEKLIADKRLKNYTGESEMKVGPDPDSAESRALGWMHNNCGVSCHNTNPNSKGYSSGMRLILDPTQLDGRPTDEFIAIQTTVGKQAFSLQWQGQVRVTPGAPDQSLLVKLITSRGDPRQQMPPIGTNYIDDNNIQVVKDWISGMKPESEEAQPD
jgi:hypothetical protein